MVIKLVCLMCSYFTSLPSRFIASCDGAVCSQIPPTGHALDVFGRERACAHQPLVLESERARAMRVTYLGRRSTNCRCM